MASSVRRGGVSARTLEMLGTTGAGGFTQPGRVLGVDGGYRWLDSVCSISNGTIWLGAAVGVPWAKEDMESYLQVAQVPDECLAVGIVKGIFTDDADENQQVKIWLQWTRYPEVVQGQARSKGELLLSTDRSVVAAADISGCVTLNGTLPFAPTHGKPPDPC